MSSIKIIMLEHGNQEQYLNMCHFRPKTDPLLELNTPPLQRPNRNTGPKVYVDNYITADGTPLYKLRKRYPHYGRRKRDVATIISREPRQSPWTLLDPVTGRVIK